MPSKLPPANRIPRVPIERVFEVESYIVGSWGETPPPDPPTEVHLIHRLDETGCGILLRFTSPDGLDTLIAALEHHRAVVWPHEPKGGG